MPDSVSGDVLSEQTTSPAFVEDANDVFNEEAVVGCAEAFSGDAVGLARVAANDAIHCSTPASSVEGSNVRPDRRGNQATFVHTTDKRRGGKGFPLNVSDAARVGSGDMDAEAEAPDSGTEFDEVEGT